MIDFKPVPFMAYEEVQILDTLLQERKPKVCLEWGSGGSTVYFPETHPSLTLWRSLEHDGDWYNALQDHGYPDTVNLLLIPERVYWLPDILQEATYDFILIDGIERVKCMEQAGRLLMPGGFVVLHDSGRMRYKAGYKYFKHWKELAPGIGEMPDGGYDFRGLTMFWND